MPTIFNDFLKPEAKILLNNINNYLMQDHYQRTSICSYCNKRINPSVLPLRLWNKDQKHFIEFHVECIIKEEKLKVFIDFIDNFDYIYEIEE